MHNITLYMRIWGEVRNFASQKFRLTPDPKNRKSCRSKPLSGTWSDPWSLCALGC